MNTLHDQSRAERLKSFFDSLYNEGSQDIQIRRTREKVEERIHCFGESYDTAKAKVKDVGCDCPAVWVVIDAEFNGVE